MKQENNNIDTVLSRSRQYAVNRNDRFWTNTLNFLGTVSRAQGFPAFLVSWAQEVVNILKDEQKAKLWLILPANGSWGIQEGGRDNCLFAYNKNEHIYIGYRLYQYLKERNDYKLLAGMLLHITAEFIMRTRAEKKRSLVDMNKNHGEAMRLERSLVGPGKPGETKLRDLLAELSDRERKRRRIAIDKKDVFVSGCAISGEEIVAEIDSLDQREESYILQLVPGQQKKMAYSGGRFTVQAPVFNDLFKLDRIDFGEYCCLMKIIDDFFVEEAVINSQGLFYELLRYIRALDREEERDNQLLKILWVSVRGYVSQKMSRHEVVYSLFLVIDEYLSSQS